MEVQDITVDGGTKPADTTKPIVEPIIVEPVGPTTTTVPTPAPTPPKDTEIKAPAAETNPFKSACAYCKVKLIASLALDISIVLMVLALSYHLLKRAKNVKA